MSYIKNLSVQITTVQQTALEAAIDAAVAELNGFKLLLLPRASGRKFLQYRRGVYRMFLKQ